MGRSPSKARARRAKDDGGDYEVGAIDSDWDKGQATFVQAYTCVLYDAALNPTERILYLMLIRYLVSSESVWPGQRRLAAELRRDVRTVKRCIASLLRRGLIEVIPPSPKRQTNTYFFKRLDKVYDADHIEFTSRIRTHDEVITKWGNVPDDASEGTFMSPARDAAPRGHKCPRVGDVDVPGVGDINVPGLGTKTSPEVDVEESHEVIEEQEGRSSRVAGNKVSLVEKNDKTVEKGGDGEEEDVDRADSSPVESSGHKSDFIGPRAASSRSQFAAMYGAAPTGEKFVAVSTDPETKTGLTVPTSAQHLYSIWCDELVKVYPDFSSSSYTGPVVGLSKSLFKRYVEDRPASEAHHIVRMFRVLIWDWHAIKKNFKWWSSAVPDLRAVSQFADDLSAAVKTGIIAPPTHRESKYYRRFVAIESGVSEQPLDSIGQAAAAAGKSRAKYVRDLQRGYTLESVMTEWDGAPVDF